MAKFAKVLMMAGMLAGASAFAAGEGEDGAPAAAAEGLCAKASTWTHWLLDGVDWVNPLTYRADIQANHTAKVRLVKYATVAYLVASNQTVQGAVLSAVEAVQNALGTAEEEIQAEEEPNRLVIGRKA